MYACMECGRKFRTASAAYRASNHGCPKCGGVDIDIDVREQRSKIGDALTRLSAMKLNDAANVNGRHVERVASGWLIDGQFASSPRRIAALL